MLKVYFIKMNFFIGISKISSFVQVLKLSENEVILLKNDFSQTTKQFPLTRMNLFYKKIGFHYLVKLFALARMIPCTKNEKTFSMKYFFKTFDRLHSKLRI